ncbi:MAG: hypothetical protein AAFX87_12090 [Bacteroidota bacterium]
MEESHLNHQAIKRYSQEFASKILDDFFLENTLVQGKQILNITPVKQINLFVIKQLLSEWKEEAKKLHSPYFDYDNEEVKKALKEYMNILSQHIAVNRLDFEQLLVKGVYDSVLIVFSPYDYYCKEVTNKEVDAITLQNLKEISKYVKVNNHLLQALITRFERDKLDQVSHDEAYNILNEVFGEIGETPDDIESYYQQFSEVLTLDLDSIYSMPEKRSEPQPVSQPVVQEEPQYEASEPSETLNQEPLIGNQETLNDKLASDSRPTLADLHENSKIESIKKYISINQRYMFINELFDGNQEEFEKIIHHLDDCGTRKDAEMYLQENFGSWDIDKEEVQEFMAILDKRYD